MGLDKGKVKVEEIKKFVDKQKKCPTCHRAYFDLPINQVPKQTNEEFRRWCDVNFCGHWGMGLKWLWDFHKGILLTGHERAEAKADEALNQIAEIQKEPAEPGYRTKTMINGKVKRYKK